MVAVILIVDFILFGYLPLHKTKIAIRQTKSALKLAINKCSAGSQQLPLLTNQLHQLQSTVSNYDVKVPTDRALGTFLQQIANLMTEHNLSEQVVTPGAEIKADNLSCIPINIQCKGTLIQVFQFYKRLQSIDRLVRVEQVKLVNDVSLTGQASMETKAVIYYRPNAQPDKEPLG